MGLTAGCPGPTNLRRTVFLSVWVFALEPDPSFLISYACSAHHFFSPEVIFRRAQFQEGSGHSSVAIVTTLLVGKQWKEEEKKESKGQSEEEGKPFMI